MVRVVYVRPRNLLHRQTTISACHMAAWVATIQYEIDPHARWVNVVDGLRSAVAIVWGFHSTAWLVLTWQNYDICTRTCVCKRINKYILKTVCERFSSTDLQFPGECYMNLTFFKLFNSGQHSFPKQCFFSLAHTMLWTMHEQQHIEHLYC